jgi:hypothetical protein
VGPQFVADGERRDSEQGDGRQQAEAEAVDEGARADGQHHRDQWAGGETVPDDGPARTDVPVAGGHQRRDRQDRAEEPRERPQDDEYGAERVGARAGQRERDERGEDHRQPRDGGVPAEPPEPACDLPVAGDQARYPDDHQHPGEHRPQRDQRPLYPEGAERRRVEQVRVGLGGAEPAGRHRGEDGEDAAEDRRRAEPAGGSFVHSDRPQRPDGSVAGDDDGRAVDDRGRQQVVAAGQRPRRVPEAVLEGGQHERFVRVVG